MASRKENVDLDLGGNKMQNVSGFTDSSGDPLTSLFMPSISTATSGTVNVALIAGRHNVYDVTTSGSITLNVTSSARARVLIRVTLGGNNHLPTLQFGGNAGNVRWRDRTAPTFANLQSGSMYVFDCYTDGTYLDIISWYGYLVAWSPSSLTGTQGIWIDFSDSTTITQASNLISQANDKFSAGRNLTASGSVRPTLTTNALNGLSVATFDGTDDLLSTTSAGSSGVANCSIILVGKWITGGSNEDIPVSIGPGGVTNAGRHMYRASGQTSLGFAAWSNDISSSALSVDAGGGYHIFSVIQNGTALRLGRDGSSDAKTLGSSPGAVSSNTFLLGGVSFNASYQTNIAIAEVIVMYSNISTTDLEKLEGYLAWKYALTANLPSNHAYKNVAP